jgi:hypothetical protein
MAQTDLHQVQDNLSIARQELNTGFPFDDFIMRWSLVLGLNSFLMALFTTKNQQLVVIPRSFLMGALLVILVIGYGLMFKYIFRKDPLSYSRELLVQQFIPVIMLFVVAALAWYMPNPNTAHISIKVLVPAMFFTVCTGLLFWITKDRSRLFLCGFVAYVLMLGGSWQTIPINYKQPILLCVAGASFLIMAAIMALQLRTTKVASAPPAQSDISIVEQTKNIDRLKQDMATIYQAMAAESPYLDKSMKQGLLGCVGGLGVVVFTLLPFQMPIIAELAICMIIFGCAMGFELVLRKRGIMKQVKAVPDIVETNIRFFGGIALGVIAIAMVMWIFYLASFTELFETARGSMSLMGFSLIASTVNLIKFGNDRNRWPHLATLAIFLPLSFVEPLLVQSNFPTLLGVGVVGGGLAQYATARYLLLHGRNTQIVTD